jgi:uncharacterized membrane protein YgcG
MNGNDHLSVKWELMHSIPVSVSRVYGNKSILTQGQSADICVSLSALESKTVAQLFVVPHVQKRQFM